MKDKHINYNAIDWEDLVYYDESSPTFLRWKIEIRSGEGRRINVSPGDVAGSMGLVGYGKPRTTIGYKGKTYYVHRIIWVIFNKCIDESLVVDHIDGIPTNNNINNLRLVKTEINTRNKCRQSNKTDLVGVYLRFIRVHYQYYAGWRDENSKLKCKYFSCTKYGEEQARLMAKEYRNKMITEMNEVGAGYTDKHFNV